MNVSEIKFFQDQTDGGLAAIIDGKVFQEVARAEITKGGARLFDSVGGLIAEAPIGKATAKTQTLENMPEKTRQEIFKYLRNDED